MVTYHHHHHHHHRLIFTLFLNLFTHFLPSSPLLLFFLFYFPSFCRLTSHPLSFLPYTFPSSLSHSLFPSSSFLPFSLPLRLSSSPRLSSLRCQCQVVWTPLPMVLLSPSSSRRVSTATPNSRAATRWCSIATRIPVSKATAPSGLEGLRTFQNLLWTWVETRFFWVLPGF